MLTSEHQSIVSKGSNSRFLLMHSIRSKGMEWVWGRAGERKGWMTAAQICMCVLAEHSRDGSESSE